MAQDEHFLSSSNSGGSSGGVGGGAGGGGGGGGGGGVNSNRPKNIKPKKIPQRGLGVAQLEKIRLEEQRKREALQAANALANNAIGSGSDSVQSPNLGPNLIPLSPSQTNFVSPNSIWPRLWSGEYNLEGGEKQRVDHVGFTFDHQVNVNLQYESNGPVLPISGNVPRRLYQFQRPHPSSVVNASSGISPSSVSSSQIEPPSIQSVRGNSYTSSSSSWPEDDKIVGMKRYYPFSLESPQASTPSFLGSFHHTYSALRSRSDDLPSCSGEPRNKYIRDGPLNSTPGPEQNPSEDVRTIGDFLTLAPPVDASPLLNSKNKHPLDYLGHQGPDLSDHRSLSIQENLKSSLTHHLGSSATKEQPFSFFPIKSLTDIHVRNGNGEKGEKLDLNLKL